jgi:hypothetical protein
MTETSNTPPPTPPGQPSTPTSPIDPNGPSQFSQDYRRDWLFVRSLALWNRLLSQEPNSGGMGVTELDMWDVYLLNRGWAQTTINFALNANPPIGS